MLPNPDALRAVADFLAEHNIPYMVIGGLANSVWGEVRATRDADFKISIGDRSLSEFRELVRLACRTGLTSSACSFGRNQNSTRNIF